MSNQNTNVDSLNSGEFDKPTLPTGLNVLTILTFIGSGLQLIGGLFSFFNAQKTFETKDKVLAQMSSGEMPGWMKSMMPDPTNFEEMVTKSFENKLPILILALVAASLCIYGAMQMRKLKKQGFLFYVIGQIIPFISTALFLGMFMFSGVGFAVGTGITILFILLYFIQRKYLVY